MAGRIPPAIIEEILERTDLVELIGEYVLLKKKGRNFWGLCPFHNEDTPSFSVTQEKQFYYCFGCHAKGNAIGFLMEMEHLSFTEAVEKLAQRVHIEIEKQAVDPAVERAQQEKQAIYRLNEIAAFFFQQQLSAADAAPARTYLSRRGVAEEMIEKFRLGYAPDHWNDLLDFLTQRGFQPDLMVKAGLVRKSDKAAGRYYDNFRGRIMFPIHDYKGNIVAFGGRVLGDGTPKYLNTGDTPVFNKSRTLYGLWFAGQEIRRRDQVVLMEGYMDVIAAHQYGVTNAIATLGTALTPGHGNLLKRYTTNALLAYDGDNAGANANLRGVDILREQGFQIKVLPMPEGLDPDDFLRRQGRSGWEDLVAEKTLGLLEYKMEQAFASQDSSTIDGKGAIVRSLLPEVLRQKNQVERDMFLHLLAQRLGVSEASLYADLRKLSGSKEEAGKKETVAVNLPKVSEQGKDKSSRNLVKYMLENREVFVEVKQEIGLDFPKDNNLRELLALADRLGEGYHFNPAALFSFLEQGEVQDTLVELLKLPAPTGDVKGLAQGCLRAVQIQRLKQQRDEILRSLSSLREGEQLKEALAKSSELQQQILHLQQ